MIWRHYQRLRAEVERLGNRGRNAGVILMYHRVAPLQSDPQLLNVPPERFEQQLRILQSVASPMSLAELLRRRGNNSLPERAVAITFDDGYADNLRFARPLLDRFSIPATIFVASGYTGTQREFWWDAIERQLLGPGELPAGLELSVGLRTYRWRTASVAGASGWNVQSPSTPTLRQQAYLDLCGIVRALGSNQQAAVLGHLSGWSGIPLTARAEYRALTADELKTLHEGGSIEVGAHTVSHLQLSGKHLEEQAKEIAGSKHELERLLGRPVTAFAYPYGARSDYDRISRQAARAAGFASACSNFPGSVWRTTDAYQLPRQIIRNWDAAEFTARLETFFRP